MRAADRAALAETCARAGVALVADETNAELRLDGPAPAAPLAAADPGGAVLAIGSMSKAAWGGLRLGWIRAAPRLVRELAATRADLDIASPVLDQLVGAELMADWDAVLASRRALLRPRRDALLAALAAHAPGWSARRPRGGLSAWVRLPAPVATRLAAAAARRGIVVTPGPSFSVDGTFERHLRLPFTLPPEDLDAAVRALAEIAAGLGPAAEAPDVLAAAV
jgi:DNA-binding transcriptional MocR family regulator